MRLEKNVKSILAVGMYNTEQEEPHDGKLAILPDLQLVPMHIQSSRRHISLLASSKSSLHYYYTAFVFLASSSSSLIVSPFSLPITNINNNKVHAAFFFHRQSNNNSIKSQLQSTATDSDIISMKSESSKTSTNNNISIPNMKKSTLQNLVEYTTSFSAANGLQVEVLTPSSTTTQTSTNNSSPSNTKKSYITAPISLLPQSYPHEQFAQAISLSGPFNELVDRISRNGQFLKDTLKDVRDVDLYTGKLLELYEEIYLGK